MASTVIKNWDNKTWLSSKDYIKSFNKFLLKNIKLNSNSKVLDIGCGRGKIVGNLNSKFKFKNKPIGIDIINHKDKDKRIRFKQISASTFFFKNKIKFDLILIKQTIHLLNFKDIKTLLNLSKKNLNKNGKIFIFTLDTFKNEIPTFTLMKSNLLRSLKKDTKILKLKKKLFKHKEIKFIYRVNIIKKKYIKMIENRYISCLLNVSNKQLNKGIDEIKLKFKNPIEFTDTLKCISFRK